MSIQKIMLFIASILLILALIGIGAALYNRKYDDKVRLSYSITENKNNVKQLDHLIIKKVSKAEKPSSIINAY